MGSNGFEAVFVDFYGTIVTGDRAAVEGTCQRIVSDLGLAHTAQELAVEWGKIFFGTIGKCNHDHFMNLHECECVSLVETLEPYLGKIDPEPYVGMLKEYWQNPPLFAEAHEALAGIDLPVCVVSNADDEDIYGAIERHSLRFDAVVTSEECRCYKPDPAIFQIAMKKMGVAPERVFHVGDSLHSDVSGARSCGIRGVWICRDDRIFDVGTGQADHKIHSLLEIRDFL